MLRPSLQLGAVRVAGMVGAALKCQHGGAWWAGWQQQSPPPLPRRDSGWLLLGVALAGRYATRVLQVFRSLANSAGNASK
jgi:hypothetical protein